VVANTSVRLARLPPLARTWNVWFRIVEAEVVVLDGDCAVRRDPGGVGTFVAETVVSSRLTSGDENGEPAESRVVTCCG
jgi:hypothetical protein